MSSAAHPIAPDTEVPLKGRRRLGLLHFIACGSVDDGKSTLVGRLLYESKTLFTDQFAALARDSRKFGTQGGELDFALLVDGLAAEREQKITIDVAYRYFSTDRRAFIVADTPGHEQYTRNMVTGGSNAEAAIVLVDARNGVLAQTRRHSLLLALLGIRHVLLAVNKMDLVEYSEDRYREIDARYRAFAGEVGLQQVAGIPISALKGDNVFVPSPRMPWHPNSTLMDWLEAVQVDEERMRKRPLRMPVQWVNRPNAEFRGFSGTLVGGEAKPGDRVIVQPSGRQTTIARIVTMDGDLEHAVAGQAATLVLSDEIDVSRADIICAAESPAEVADRFEADIIWMDEQPMLRGRTYLMKIATKTVRATIAPLKYKVNVDTLEHLAADKLELNGIGVCEIETDQPVPFDPYREYRDTGGFILIDRFSNHTVGAGMLRFALRRAHNVRRQPIQVQKEERAALKGQRARVVWLTGLPGAGKSTIANLVEQKLHAMGRHTYLLDGDNIRRGLNMDLGFTAEDRVENIRRIAEVATLMVDAGLIVIAAFISPFRAERRMARELFEPGEFIEVFVDVPLSVAEQRDPKGLYRKAKSGEITNLTGIDSPYEVPDNPELHVNTSEISAEEAAARILRALELN